MKNLPGGVFYLLAGTRLSGMNVWKVSSGGGQISLTHNQAPFGISSLSASRAGVIVADAAYGVDDLAMLTRSGASWLHPYKKSHGFIHGSSPDIRDDGEITYITPPAGPGPGSRDFIVWSQPSITGKPRVVYERRTDLGVPIFGPNGQEAVIGPIGPYRVGHRPEVLIVSARGHVQVLRTGFTVLGYPPAWGDQAPALGISSWSDEAKVIFPGGGAESLPLGWQPLTWDPSGHQLLVRSRTSLGVWSLRDPSRVRVVGALSPAFHVIEASWLRQAAPM